MSELHNEWRINHCYCGFLESLDRNGWNSFAQWQTTQSYELEPIREDSHLKAFKYLDFNTWKAAQAVSFSSRDTSDQQVVRKEN